MKCWHSENDGGPVDDRLYGEPRNDTLSGGQGTTIDVDWV